MSWRFTIVNRAWYLIDQSSYMKSTYRICKDWFPEQDEKKWKPEYRERNKIGSGIIEETNALWSSLQEHFLEPEQRVEIKPSCSLSSCNAVYARKRCSRCKLCYYCCQEHQAADWAKHKKICVRPTFTLEQQVEVYRRSSPEDIEKHRLSVLDLYRTKGIDLTTGEEWYTS